MEFIFLKLFLKNLFLFVLWQRNIRHIRDFVNMKDEERRLMLRSLSDHDYLDVIAVCAKLPYVEMTVKTEGRCKKKATAYSATWNILQKCMSRKYRSMPVIYGTVHLSDMHLIDRLYFFCYFITMFLPFFSKKIDCLIKLKVSLLCSVGKGGRK